MPDLQLKLTYEQLGSQEAVLVEWRKQIGDWVRKNEELAICETDGRQISFKAPAQGALQKIAVAAGQTFRVGEILGIIRTVMGGT